MRIDGSGCSVVTLCSCGARFAASTRAAACRLIADHQVRAGCEDHGKQAASYVSNYRARNK